MSLIASDGRTEGRYRLGGVGVRYVVAVCGFCSGVCSLMRVNRSAACRVGYMSWK